MSTTVTEYISKGYTGCWGPVKDRPVISTVKVCKNSTHWTLHIWSRGMKSGILVVDAADGQKVVDMLLPKKCREEMEREC